ncbi:MAG: hypothetical protein DRP35_01855 [Candidatus Zixiibacteriota bacterium]|nr:MAG: hypothetical protein DRP35_01855 [candidate division Zixibacteria bacterium]
MKKLLLLALMVVIFFVLLISCSSDIILKSESDIRGEFEGTYSVTSNWGDANAEVRKQNIIWNFTDEAYIMKVDTTKDFDESYCICRVDGKYVIEDAVVFSELHALPIEMYGCNTCDKTTTPKGRFTLIKSSNADTLTLNQFDTDNDFYKEIKLYRIADFEEE